MIKPVQAAIPEQDSQAPPGADPGMFAMIVIIGITIFAFIFIFFVSGVE